jgi:hypothetical protein
VPRWDLAPWPLPIESGSPPEPVDGEPVPASPPSPPPTPVSPTIERIEIPMNKTTLHPDLRPHLAGNDDVRLVQVLALGLHALSGHPTFDVGAVDADYGPRTQAAARLMQQLNGLDVDGIVGPLSWAAFLNADGA